MNLSLGYCGKCKLIYQDDNVVRYVYSGENWNDEKSISGDIDLLDGEIWMKEKVEKLGGSIWRTVPILLNNL